MLLKVSPRCQHPRAPCLVSASSPTETPTRRATGLYTLVLSLCSARSKGARTYPASGSVVPSPTPSALANSLLPPCSLCPRFADLLLCAPASHHTSVFQTYGSYRKQLARGRSTFSHHHHHHTMPNRPAINSVTTSQHSIHCPMLCSCQAPRLPCKRLHHAVRVKITAHRRGSFRSRGGCARRIALRGRFLHHGPRNPTCSLYLWHIPLQRLCYIIIRFFL